MKANAHFWSYLAHFLEWKMFQTKVVEKIKTHILYSIPLFSPLKSCRLWDNVEKCCRAGQATDDNIIRRVGFAKATNTHSDYVTLIAFPLQQRLQGRASTLRYTALPVLFSSPKRPYRLYLLLNGYRASPPPRYKVAGVVRVTTDLRLVPRLRLGGAVPPLRLYAFVTCIGTTSPFFSSSFSSFSSSPFSSSSSSLEQRVE